MLKQIDAIFTSTAYLTFLTTNITSCLKSLLFTMLAGCRPGWQRMTCLHPKKRAVLPSHDVSVTAGFLFDNVESH
jgi:hypothetical protein